MEIRSGNKNLNPSLWKLETDEKKISTQMERDCHHQVKHLAHFLKHIFHKHLCTKLEHF